jgi:hypothetical protein
VRRLQEDDIVADEKTHMRFTATDVTSYPRLSWRKEVFGTRIPWAHTVVADMYSGLIGRKTADLASEETLADLEVVLNQLGLFESVSRKSGVVPALLLT